MSKKNLNNLFHRVWLEIDLNAIATNIHSYQQVIHPSKLMVVVKAFGYNTMGGTSIKAIKPIITTCVKKGITQFAVSRLQEVMILRKILPSDIEIFLLGSFFKEEAADLIQNDTTISIYHFDQINLLKDLSIKFKKPIHVHVLIDTGMGRLGIPYYEAKDFLRTLSTTVKNSRIKITGIYSHLSNAQEKNDWHTSKQIERFAQIKEWAIKYFSSSLVFHLANSWGGGNYPDSWHDWVRVGIGLYGVSQNNMNHVHLTPAVTWKSRLIAKRKLPKGYPISYHCSYRLPTDTLVGIVAAGYADGIPFNMSSQILNDMSVIKDASEVFQGYMLVSGSKVPVLGRVTMDYTMLNLNDVPNVGIGDEVVIIGKQNSNEISALEFAHYKGTHEYEVLCSIPSLRVPRVFIK